MATTHFDVVNANRFEIPSSSLFAGTATITKATTGITVTIPGVADTDTVVATATGSVGIVMASLTTNVLTLMKYNAAGSPITGAVYYLVVKRN